MNPEPLTALEIVLTDSGQRKQKRLGSALGMDKATGAFEIYLQNM